MTTFRSLTFLVLLAAAAAPLAAQDDAKSQTVLDYYQLLTPEQLPLLEGISVPRKDLIKTQDVANGFLALAREESTGQVALFRKKDRSAVIGVAEMSCAPACAGLVKFLEHRDGKWRDVTEALLPRPTDAQILAAYNKVKKPGDEKRSLKEPPWVYWELPRTGTTVTMRSGDTGSSGDKVLMRFAWDGARFARLDK